jgi:hypothetical protein
MFVVVAFSLWAQSAVGLPQGDVAPADVSIEAGLVLPNGDVRRLARTPLVLLDADLGSQLSQQAQRQHPRRRISNDPGVYLRLFLALRDLAATGGSLSVTDVQYVYEAGAFIKAHTVESVTTDFDGKATFQTRPGDYFLFCSLPSEGKDIVWHLPVHLRSGKNSLVLDQNNLVK